MMEKRFLILVGDANGADRAVQRYLADKAYRNVIVHCMAGNCRNNIANWPVRAVPAPIGVRGFAYYALKDKAMVEDAAYGLMLWDGESKGTLNNVVNMVIRQKPVVVYFAPKKTFQNLRSRDDIRNLLSNCGEASVRRLERELGIANAMHQGANTIAH
ncbi:MAG TPA: hypothetical protein VEF03_10995 [Candidatus Binataceae bacterium]|nr:hypothetical protein [Candidatus Binataceae bacterium]